jgi:hypothetical protein
MFLLKLKKCHKNGRSVTFLLFELRVMPTKQDEDEARWIDEHVPHDFNPKDTVSGKALQRRFGNRIAFDELLSLAEIIAKQIEGEDGPQLKQRLIRACKRRRRILQWWYEENWDIVKPILDTRVDVKLRADGRLI